MVKVVCPDAAHALQRTQRVRDVLDADSASGADGLRSSDDARGDVNIGFVGQPGVEEGAENGAAAFHEEVCTPEVPQVS
jgi:hypothetical protein